ncbi:MAG: SpoIIE family protein phosphatase, partial [Mariniblastus sp.]|nr:SpoIIE family protein phosphatase [Mariniblastus sp.]
YVKVLPDPGAMVGMLNEDLSERMDDGMFLTLFLALITEAGEVTLVNAGHTPPLIWRAATGEIETVKAATVKAATAKVGRVVAKGDPVRRGVLGKAVAARVAVRGVAVATVKNRIPTM